MPERDLVFFSYRHDEHGHFWLSLILRRLEPYILDSSIVAWSDRDIRTGERWDARILSMIERARVAVVLVNQTLFGSAYICNKELPRLVQAAEAGELTLVCVPVGPVHQALLARYGLDAYQFTHDPHLPLIAMADGRREEALVDVAVKVYEAFKKYGPSNQMSIVPVDNFNAARLVTPINAPAKQVGATRGRLFDVPPIDEHHFVSRDIELIEIRKELLHGSALIHGLTSVAPRLGLHGMGGMGKTVMAQALCHDSDIQQAFPDGIAWITLGQEPDLLALQNRLLRYFALKEGFAAFSNDAREALVAAMQSRRILIVIDDIWEASHFNAFDVVSRHSRILITTRDATILTQLRARTYELQRLPLLLARQLLANWADINDSELPAEADKVAEQADGLPLALALAGAQVADGLKWATLAQQMEQGRVRFLDHPYGSVYDSLSRSVDALKPDERQHYLDLAVFPEDVAVPFGVIARMWKYSGLDDAETERLLVRFKRKALLTIESADDVLLVRLHDLQRDFARARCNDIVALHGQLLQAYRNTLSLPHGANGWALVPTSDAYLWRHLAIHLVSAGKSRELELALLDLNVIRARLQAEIEIIGGEHLIDLGALQSDYAFLPPESEAQIVGRALRRSAHVLTKRPELLEQQLFGRLNHSDESAICALVACCRDRLEKQVALVPIRSTLTPPLMSEAVFADHEGSVIGAIQATQGNRALSWSEDYTIRLWDLHKNRSLHTFSGHEETINGVLIMPDNQYALSWSDDHALRLWNLETGSVSQVLTGHEGPVVGALVLPDARHVLSWSRDWTLRLWDVHKGNTVQLLEGHENKVDGALLLPNGQQVLSWSYDHTLRLWDLQKGSAVRIYRGHKHKVDGAILLPGAQKALSWSFDQTLCLWNIEEETPEKILTGHTSAVEDVMLLSDNRRALSWSNDGMFGLWDLEKGTKLRLFPGHAGLIGSPLTFLDGQRALCCYRGAAPQVLELKQGEVIKEYLELEFQVDGALLLPDRQRVLFWLFDGTLQVWDLDRGCAIKVLAKHGGQINGALMLDNSRSLSWSADGTLRLWEVEEPRAMHVGSLYGILFPDDRHLLSWSKSELQLWDLKHGRIIQQLAKHGQQIYGAELLPDNRRVLCWLNDKTLQLWDLHSGNIVQFLVGHDKKVNGALVLPDGQHALSWSDDCTLRLWNLEHGNTIRVLSGHKYHITSALIFSEGQRAVSWSSDGLRLWNLKEGRMEAILGGTIINWVNGVVLLPGERRMLSWSSSSLNQVIHVWALESTSNAKVLEGHKGVINGAFGLQDYRRALSWSDDRTIRLWDLHKNRCLRTFSGHEDAVNGVLLLPDQQHALSWSDDNTLRQWDLESGSASQVFIGHEGSVIGAMLLPDGCRVVTWASDETVRLWDLMTAKELGIYSVDAAVTKITPYLNGTHLFIGDALGGAHLLRVASPAVGFVKHQLS